MLASLHCAPFLWSMRFQQCLSTCSSYIDKNVLHIHGLNLTHDLLCAFRGEAVCLLHVRQAFFPTLPPAETQPHSYGYVSSQTPVFLCLKLVLCMLNYFQFSLRANHFQIFKSKSTTFHNWINSATWSYYFRCYFILHFILWYWEQLSPSLWPEWMLELILKWD